LIVLANTARRRRTRGSKPATLLRTARKAPVKAKYEGRTKLRRKRERRSGKPGDQRKVKFQEEASESKGQTHPGVKKKFVIRGGCEV